MTTPPHDNPHARPHYPPPPEDRGRWPWIFGGVVLLIVITVAALAGCAAPIAGQATPAQPAAARTTPPTPTATILPPAPATTVPPKYTPAEWAFIAAYPTMNPDAAIEGGYAICTSLEAGIPQPQLIESIQDMAGIDLESAKRIVYAATTHLCPR